MRFWIETSTNRISSSETSLEFQGKKCKTSLTFSEDNQYMMFHLSAILKFQTDTVFIESEIAM